ncbi:hypothetical protein PVAND_001100 [Polypedilum vanderplanki]|uniref:Peptidase S1 domain-containing protein n=1 Tax=Polypedilum vanderplanki TaxID=319348 RepID=A0A9J6BN60_POLVA|nr:hypothetical protein PVAND_001100 [Polypedilum vanderplanki]
MWIEFCLSILLLTQINCKTDFDNYEDHTTFDDEIIDDENITENCGIMSKASGLIQGGDFSSRHDFPWMASISTLNNKGIWLHKGSGSLISRKHVIVKARSVSFLDNEKNWIPLSTDRVKIYLGTTKHADARDEGSIEVGVRKIKNYRNARKVSSAFSIFNFAVITLDRNVKFNDFIKPICLWNLDETFENELIDKSAYAVGYGVDESGEVSHIRKHVRVTITSDSTCRNDYKDEIDAGKDSKFFCIISIESDKTPCHFDSQLYVKVDDVWYLKGILCSARMYMGFKICAVSYPVLAEDISPYVKWINDEMKKS